MTGDTGRVIGSGRHLPARRPTATSKLVSVGLAYVGLAATLSGLAFVVGPVSVFLVVALALGWIGWHGLKVWPALRTYLLYAGALSVWFCVSSIAAWEASALLWSAVASVWLLFIIPGLANLLRRQRYRASLMVGILAAVLAFALTGVGRLVAGREVFDLPNPGRSVLLGTKRGLVNARLLFAIPFFVMNEPRMRWFRWIGAALATAGIVISGGRSGLLGLAVVALVMTISRPGAAQKLRNILAAGLVGLLFVTLVAEFGGQALIGQNRLVAYIRGERTTSDQVREAQLKRAWRTAVANPFFGVGYGNLESQRDEDAFAVVRNPLSRERAIEGGVHNTYAQILAEFGFPALIAFLMLTFALLRAAVASRDRADMRALLAGFTGTMLMMVFHNLAVSFLYMALAYLVGALGDQTEVPRGEEEIRRRPIGYQR